MFTDAHAHLTLRELSSHRDEVLARARAASVETILTIGIDPQDSAAAVAVAEACPGVYATVGVHPHEAAQWDGAVRDHQAGLLASSRVVAVGETGLDYYRDRSPRPAQQTAFEEQIGLACAAGLPLVVHCRDAHEDCLSVLRAARPAFGGVMHCFSGGWEFATQVLDLGFHISFAGPLTYPRAKGLRKVAARAPLDRLLIETDAPFLAPQPVRGKTNEPAFVTHTAKALAAARGVSVGVVGEATTANFERLFLGGRGENPTRPPSGSTRPSARS